MVKDSPTYSTIFVSNDHQCRHAPLTPDAPYHIKDSSHVENTRIKPFKGFCRNNENEGTIRISLISQAMEITALYLCKQIVKAAPDQYYPC